MQMYFLWNNKNSFLKNNEGGNPLGKAFKAADIASNKSQES